MPTARSFFAVAAFKNAGGKTLIYTFGGLQATTTSAVVEAYDPIANTWTRKAPMPGPRFITNGATVLNGKIYVLGGWLDRFDASPAGAFYEYTPATNRWRDLGTGPCAYVCGNGVSGAIGGKLYNYRGNDGTDNETMDVYDTVTQRWDTLAKSVYPHDGATGAVVGGKFYVFGGGEGSCEVYDPATNSWRSVAPMPVEMQYGSSTVLNGKIYVFGGGSIPSVLVQIYDPASDHWSLGVPLTNVRGGVGVAAVTASNGRTVAYVSGGTDSSQWARMFKTNQAFDPTVPNKPPVAVANGPYAGAAGTPIQFSALGTFDPEGAWNGTWAFGDGSSYTGVFGNFASQNPLHTYPSPGAYSVTFTVTDASGASTATSATANIQ